MKLSRLLIVISVMYAGTSFAQLQNAPASFSYNGARAVPMDISSVHVSYNFDVAKKQVLGTAKVYFQTGESGYPFFDIKPQVSKISLDEQLLSISSLQEISSPDGATSVRAVKELVESHVDHQLELSFQLDPKDVTFAGNNVRCGFFMSDLQRPDFGWLHFFERYGPANLEFDQIKFTFDVKVSGTSNPHRVFTNGDVTEIAKNQWSVVFPDYFTSSSIYFHIANAEAFGVAEGSYQGLEREIPILAYSGTRAGAQTALSRTRTELQELESTFGPSLHKKYVVYATESFPGGMEHSGATITAFNALSHEISHSWFARGIMPANGNSGWIDEAIASWRDNGYPTGAISMLRPVNLGGFSEYKRSTTEQAYNEGADLIAGLNARYRNFGGMKAILGAWFEGAKGTVVTTEEFKSYLENSTGDDLTSIFNRRVYGRGKQGPVEARTKSSSHPKPFTFEQYKSLR